MVDHFNLATILFLEENAIQKACPNKSFLEQWGQSMTLIFNVVRGLQSSFEMKDLTSVLNLTFSVTQKQRRGRSEFCFLRGACLS